MFNWLSDYAACFSRSFPIKSGLLITLVVAALPTASPLAVSPNEVTLPPPACDCSHLDALQTELRNALRLQQAFRGKIAELRTMAAESVRGEYSKFAQGVSHGVTRPKGDTGPDAVDYTPRGDNVYAGNESQARGDLCQRSDNSELALEQMERGAVCAGIAKAIRAHEDFHKSKCSGQGYLKYRDVHPADRAAEEVEAYGVQIAELRAEIARVLERANVRVEIEVNARSDFPQNPLYRALLSNIKSEVAASRVSVSGETIRFDGEGQQVNNGTIEGNCVVSGYPFNLPAKVTVETDGLDAQIRYTVGGTIPGMSMRCTVPGAGSGYGMSLPAPINNSGNVPAVNLPLRDKAEVLTDMATTEGARIAAAGGVKITGSARTRLLLCPGAK